MSNEAAARLYDLFHAIRHDVKGYMSEAEMNATLDTALAHERSAGAVPLDVERMADLIDKAKDRRYSDESLGIIFRDIVVSSEGTDR